MTTEQALGLVAFLVSGGAYLIWRLPGPCKCEKCGYHVNERRMEATARRERAHDEQHRGRGYAVTGRDIYRCSDDDCPRNPRPPSIDSDASTRVN